MSERNGAVRRADRRRWTSTIQKHLEDFARPYAALEHAISAFGDKFDLQRFKAAYNATDDMGAYNRAQAVERAVGRVRNYVADLAIAGAKLAQLPRLPMREGSSEAQQAFEALRDAGVLNAEPCSRLTQAQRSRARIEHVYIDMTAGEVHRAALLTRQTALDFIGPYRAWIVTFLEGGYD